MPERPTTRLLLLAQVPLDTVAVPTLPALRPIEPSVLLTRPPSTLSVPVPLLPTVRVLDPFSEPEVVTMSVPVWPALVATVVVVTLVPVLIVVVPLSTTNCASALRSVMPTLAKTMAIIAAARLSRSDDPLPAWAMPMLLQAALSSVVPTSGRLSFMDAFRFVC